MQIDLYVRGWIGTFAALAAYAIPISSRTMSFPADSTGGNLRQTPLPKTCQIIALPPPECNRKSENGASRFENCPWAEHDNGFWELAQFLRIQPTLRQYHVPHQSQFQRLESPTCPTRRTRPTSNGKAGSTWAADCSLPMPMQVSQRCKMCLQ